MTDEQVRNFCKDYISKHKKLTYFKFILEKNNCLSNVLDWQKEKLKGYSFGHQLYWFVNEIIDFPICPVCGNKNIRKTRNYRCYPIEVGICCCHSHANIYNNSISKYGYYRKDTIETEEEARKFCLDYLNSKRASNFKKIAIKKGFYHFIDEWEHDKLKNYSFMFKVNWFANQIHNFPRCISCGKEITKEPRDSKEKLKKYCGPKCSQRDPNVLNRIKETRIRNNSSLKMTILRRSVVYERLNQLKNFEIVMEKDAFINSMISEINLVWRCKKCNKTFERKLVMLKDDPLICPHCNPRNPTTSLQENAFYECIKSMIPETTKVFKNYRRAIKNPDTNYWLELDIYIPSLNLAFEYNGDYWHSKEFNNGESIKRDKLKKKLCEDKNITLISVKECDWLKDRNGILSDIQNTLNYLLAE